MTLPPPNVSFKMDSVDHSGVLFAANKKRQRLILGLWFTGFAGLVLVALCVADPITKVKFGGLAIIVSVLNAMSIRNSRRGSQGIAVVEDGLIWAMTVGGTFIVPWDQIQTLEAVSDRPGKPAHRLGLRVVNPQAVGRTRADVTNLEGWRKMRGWHLSYEESHLTDSLDDIIRTIHYYGSNPSLRPLLGHCSHNEPQIT